MELITVRHVEKRYANRLALDDVSFGVPAGSVFGLLGPNGAGKTTMIRIVNQLIGPDRGEVLFEGAPMGAQHMGAIGYLPEERGLYKKMRVGEQVLYLTRLKGLSRRDALRSVTAWFDRLEINGWWGRRVEELSKGMAQRVQFVVAVAHGPRLLILDEPFSGFDPINAAMVRDQLLELRRGGATIVLSTHNMASVEELCSHIALFNRARNILSGPIDTIRQQHGGNCFEVRIGCPLEALRRGLSPDFEVLSAQAEGGMARAQIGLRGAAGPNRLLGELLPLGPVLAFNRSLPSMNDIFIRVVQDANRAHGQQPGAPHQTA